MKFLVRKYFSGYCTYEIEADNEDGAYTKAEKMPVKHDEVLCTLEDWEECNEVEPILNYERA